MTAIYECEQCDGTGTLKDGSRCPCREEDDDADQRRSQMGLVGSGLTKDELLRRLTRRDPALAERFSAASDKGKFQVVREDEPGMEELSVIGAAPWPTPTLGARQYRCQDCNGFCALGPAGQRVAKNHPNTPIVCQNCMILRVEADAARDA